MVGWGAGTGRDGLGLSRANLGVIYLPSGRGTRRGGGGVPPDGPQVLTTAMREGCEFRLGGIWKGRDTLAVLPSVLPSPA